jgi:hypothetical protein
MELKQKKDYEENEREKIKRQSLIINTNNFPELALDLKQDNLIVNNVSYLEKLKHQDVIDNSVDKDLADLKPGWIILKRDILTGKTVVKKHPEKIIIVVNKNVARNFGMDLSNLSLHPNNKFNIILIDK